MQIGVELVEQLFKFFKDSKESKSHDYPYIKKQILSQFHSISVRQIISMFEEVFENFSFIEDFIQNFKKSHPNLSASQIRIIDAIEFCLVQLAQI